MGHARLSPSASKRWMACPGSVKQEAKYPDRPSGQAAIDGTHSHTLLEHCVNNGFMDPMLVIGKEMEDHEGKFTVDLDRAQRVVKATVYLRDRFTQLSALTEVKVHAEREVDAGQMIDREDLKGTADVTLDAHDFLEIVDYKDGFTPVEVENNSQLMIYGVGALAACDDLDRIKNIRMTIIQPKMADCGGEPVTHWSLTTEELLQRFHLDIADAARMTDDPNAPLIPGEEQCKWCRAKGDCKALATKALEEAQLMFADVDMATDAANKDPNQMSDEELLQLMEAKPLILQMLEGAEKEAMRRFETGHKVPGLKVVRGRGGRKWNLADDEMAEKLKRMGMPKDAIWTTKLVSPAQAPKAVWEKRDGSKKQLSERQIERLQKEYVEHTQGKLTITLATDSRPEVAMDAETMFKDVQPAAPEIPAWLQ